MKPRCLPLMLMFLACGQAFSQDQTDLRSDVLRKAGPGWQAGRDAFEKDGIWQVKWADNLLIEITMGRRGDQLLITDQRRIRFGLPQKRPLIVVKLVDTKKGRIRLEKPSENPVWKRIGVEDLKSRDAQTRLFQVTCWACSPFALFGAPLKTIFEDEGTIVTRFEKSKDDDGVYVIDFKMKQGVESDLPGTLFMKEVVPFFIYPAECSLKLDSKHNWRVVSADYKREQTPKKTIYDHFVVEYKDDRTFVAKAGTGDSPEAAKKIKIERSVKYLPESPKPEEFSMDFYDLETIEK
ncbi:MAG: hypothetical protein AAF958_12610 [Planctomycetota bacterium]